MPMIRAMRSARRFIPFESIPVFPEVKARPDPSRSAQTAREEIYVRTQRLFVSPGRMDQGLTRILIHSGSRFQCARCSADNMDHVEASGNVASRATRNFRGR